MEIVLFIRDYTNINNAQTQDVSRSHREQSSKLFIKRSTNHYQFLAFLQDAIA